VQGAESHQLVSMLLDGALTAIANAVSALERGDIPAKCKPVSKAAAIIDEGQRGALDMQPGGQVAATLQDLYSCVLLRLTRANLQNDAAMLRECSQLLAPMRDAWNSIKPQKIAA
jgi:flagellar protein FliS